MKHPLHWRSFKAATKLRCESPTDIEIESILLEELLFLVEDIHVKTWEASQNTDFGMGEFLGINKALQSIPQGDVLNSTSKLTEINKCIKRDNKKLDKVETDPTYFDEQRQLYKDRLPDNLNREKRARLEIKSEIPSHTSRKNQANS